MAEELNLATFSEHLKTKFRVRAGDGEPVELVLIEAVDRRSDARHECFSTLFRGPGDRAVEQSTYRVEHDRMGEFDLFIVPVGVDEAGRLYEAMFNRIITSPPGTP